MLDLKTKITYSQNQKIKNFFLEKNNNEKIPETAKDVMPEKNARDILVHWRGYDREDYSQSRKFYALAGFAIAAIIAYALITDSPLVAITFILIGIVGYIHLNQAPIITDFFITKEGVAIGKNLYGFKEIDSFCFFESEKNSSAEILSIKTIGKIVQHIYIPLHNQDPEKIREILLAFIPEKEHSPNLVDIIERMLHI